MKHLLFIFLSIIAASVCYAQEEVPIEQDKLLKQEVVLAVKIHSSGFAAGVYYGLIKKKSTWIGHLSAASIKHPMEYKRRFDNPSALGDPPRAFIYGKQNSFYTVKLGVGQKFNLSSISKERNITIGASYHIGPTL